MDIKLVQETCCHQECGVPFWIDVELQSRLVSTKRNFYCPNGHSLCYQGESEKQKAIRLRNEKEQLLREKNQEIALLEEALKKCAKKKRK